MSMISAQCDELRFMAHMLDTDGHPSFAREVRRAADTIWELRNKLAGTVDQSEEIDKRTAELDFQIADNWRLTAVSESLKEQNAKLREQIHWLKKGDVLHVLTDQELADQQKHEREMRASIDALEDENAKLDRRRRSLQADVERLSGIIHRQRKELNMMQHAIECRNDENAKLQDENARFRSCLSDDAENARQIMGENAKLREVIDDITEVVEVSDPALVEFIAKRMQRVRIEVGK